MVKKVTYIFEFLPKRSFLGTILVKNALFFSSNGIKPQLSGIDVYTAMYYALLGVKTVMQWTLNHKQCITVSFGPALSGNSVTEICT